MADVLGVPVNQLLGVNDDILVLAKERGGSRAKRDIERLIGEVSALFSGGSLDEDSLDGAMHALSDAYWIAKEENKKFIPKRYRKTPEQEQAEKEEQERLQREREEQFKRERSALLERQQREQEELLAEQQRRQQTPVKSTDKDPLRRRVSKKVKALQKEQAQAEVKTPLVSEKIDGIPDGVPDGMDTNFDSVALTEKETLDAQFAESSQNSGRVGKHKPSPRARASKLDPK